MDPAPPIDVSSAKPGRLRRALRFPMRHKLITLLLIVPLVMGGAGVIVFGSYSGYVYKQLDDIPRFELNVGPDSTRPRRPKDRTQNILLIGVDEGGGADVQEAVAAEHWSPGVFRSDSIMFLHIPEDRKSADLISIPRDSYVPVPGYGTTKINAAFSYGGPSLLVKSVELLTGVYVDHVAVIDFSGFEDFTTALGGIDVYVPETVTDTMRQYTWTQGWHHLAGEKALWYVRMRYGLKRSDFDRVQRQQNFLRAIADKAASAGMLTDPIERIRLVKQVQKFVALDEGLDARVLGGLLESSRKIRAKDMHVATVPFTGTPTIDGASVVTLDVPAVRSMFEALVKERFVQWLKRHDNVDQLPSPDEVD
jgi:LCP family protein required for cell wall assembly